MLSGLCWTLETRGVAAAACAPVSVSSSGSRPTRCVAGCSAEVDEGTRPGRSTTDAEHIAELEREVRELRRANAILRSGSAFFAAELDRPQSR